MRMDLLNNVPDGQPFVQTDRLTIYVLRDKVSDKISSFHTILDGQEKIFKVKPPDKKGTNEILEAWIEMEKYTGKIL